MKRRMGAQTSRNGFTIVELLIVIVVIAILAAITIVAYNGIQNQAKSAAAQATAKQALTKIQTYAVQNADQYPATLAAAGLANAGDTTYQYRVDNSANPKTFCLTATTDNTSYYVSHTTTSPTAGACNGHAVNGGEVITNLARDPRAANPSSGEWLSRYGTSGSYRSGMSDGPVGVLSSYYRQTFTSAVSAGGRGVDHLHNLDLPYAPMPTVGWPVEGGQSVRISLYLRSSIAVSTVALTCRVYSGDSIVGSYSGASFPAPANDWVRVHVTFTPGTSGRTVCTSRYATASWQVGSSIDATGLMVVLGDEVRSYADGSSPGWIWNGTPNDSTSTGPPL